MDVCNRERGTPLNGDGFVGVKTSPLSMRQRRRTRCKRPNSGLWGDKHRLGQMSEGFSFFTSIYKIYFLYFLI